jgi:phosphoglycolate phosphatase
VVLFDFDGTLGLMRAGWMPLMLDMMMETLAPLANGHGPSARALRNEAEDYVARFTGKDTVHQMAAFAAHVESLGAVPLEAEFYKAEFIRRIEHRRMGRLHALEAGGIHADEMMVPGSRALLDRLRAAGMRIFLASGTAHDEICRDVRLLGIEHFF